MDALTRTLARLHALAELDDDAQRRAALAHIDAQGKEAPEAREHAEGDQPDGASFAAWACSLLNLLLRTAGRDSAERAAEALAESLDAAGWAVAYGPRGLYVAAPSEPDEEYGEFAERAPKGGTQINGKQYKGGMFIPSAALKAAEQKAASGDQQAKAELERLRSAKKAEAARLESRGPVDRDRLRAKLGKASQAPLGWEARQAAASARALWNHHGTLALHRIDELADAVSSAMEAAGEGTPEHAALQRRLAALAVALGHEAAHLERQPGMPPKSPEPGKVYNVNVDKLVMDPSRFQYKISGIGGEGVTDEMKQVKTWNPDFAGVVSLWKDPQDGKDYVVNGHHRRELAGRLGVKDMAVRYINAKDAREARAVGALINIAEGRGTALDAAKFMRDAGVGPEALEQRGVSLKGKLATDAALLTKLSDRQFNRLARGLLDEQKALSVAKHLADHALQDQLFGLLQKREEEGKDIGPKVIEEMARRMAAAPKMKTGGDSLFGTDEQEEALFVQQAEVTAYVRAELAKEANDWAAVASKRRAERTTGEGTGNVLDTEKNRALAEEAEQGKNVFDTLVNSRGAIADAISAATVEYAQAKSKKERDNAKRKAVEAVREAVAREGRPAGARPEDERAGTGPGGATGASAPAGPAVAPAADAGGGDAQPAGLKGPDDGRNEIAGAGGPEAPGPVRKPVAMDGGEVGAAPSGRSPGEPAPRGTAAAPGADGSPGGKGAPKADAPPAQPATPAPSAEPVGLEDYLTDEWDKIPKKERVKLDADEWDAAKTKEWEQRHNRPTQLARAQKRYDNREATARGGGIFGGEYLQGQSGIGKLPDGAPVLFTSGQHAGKTGRIVHEKGDAGQLHVTARVDGEEDRGGFPVLPDAIEPLNEQHSWRTGASGGGERQGHLDLAPNFGPKKFPAIEPAPQKPAAPAPQASAPEKFPEVGPAMMPGKAATGANDGGGPGGMAARGKEMVGATAPEKFPQAGPPEAAPQQSTAPDVMGAGVSQRDKKLISWPFHGDTVTAIREGRMTAEELRRRFDALTADPEAVKASLAKALKASGLRSPQKIKENAEYLYERALSALVPGKDISYRVPLGDPEAMARAKTDAYKKALGEIDDAHLAHVAEGHKARGESLQKAMTNPETKEEFETFISRKGEAALSPEQRAVHDDILAADRRKRDEGERARRAVVAPVASAQGYSIHEGVHTKHQTPIHVVKPDARVDAATFKGMAEAARRLGGSYQSNSRYSGGKTPDGFNFPTREAAERFGKLLGGEAVSRADDWEEARGETRQAAAARLMDLSTRTRERAEEELSRDRLTNTSRRADMASGIEARARSAAAQAETMANVAEKIASGEAKHLQGVRHGTQMEALDSALRRAQYDRRRGERYDDWKGAPFTAEDIGHVNYPHPYFDKGDLLRFAASMRGTPGAKRMAERIAKVAAKMGEEGQRIDDAGFLSDMADVAKNPAAYGLDRWQGERVKGQMNDHMRLQAADIKTLPELRAALREYLPLKRAAAKPDAVKQAERALIGKPIPGFFPTPRPVIDDMLSRADIRPGMSVLEPSAGKGDILDAVRDSVPDARTSAVEINGDLRGLLQAKGHTLAGDDFNAHHGEYDRIVMNPPFENGQDAEHIRRAYTMLRPGGKLVAIASEGPFFREDGKAREFRDWLQSVGGESEKMEPGSFAGKDAFRQTGVNTRMVTISKPDAPGPEKFPEVGPPPAAPPPGLVPEAGQDDKQAARERAKAKMAQLKLKEQKATGTRPVSETDKTDEEYMAAVDRALDNPAKASLPDLIKARHRMSTLRHWSTLDGKTEAADAYQREQEFLHAEIRKRELAREKSPPAS